MEKKIAKYLSKCNTYQRLKASHLKVASTLQPLPIPSWKWEDISMDFIVGLFNTSQKHDSIWIIVDRLKKMAHFISVHTTYTAKKYAEIHQPCHALVAKQMAGRAPIRAKPLPTP
jgi:hypothetical protein